MVKEFLPAMKERNFGHIVAIASMASYIGVPNGSVYSASKFGVKGKILTVLLAIMYMARNIELYTRTLIK